MKITWFLITLLALSFGGHVQAETEASSVTLSTSLRGSEMHDALHGDLMAERSFTDYLSGRVGFAFFLSDQTGIHGGLEAGVRANAPGIVSPFIGSGLFIGSWTSSELADNDGIDNDDDNMVDEYGEEEEVRDDLLALYPELGVNLWLADTVRISGSYRYYVTSRGRDSDSSLYGFGLGIKF